MISPKALHLLIRHLDAIDTAVSRRSLRKRPWLEPAITSLLCDLLDEETQDDERLDYTLRQLNADLATEDGLLSVRLGVETHEFHPRVERWVTQSDIGLILRFDDHLLPQHSWTHGWLFQAKRLEPDSRNPLRYSEASRIGAVDAAQSRRLAQLDDFLGGDFARFLYYTPRPDALDELTRLKLWRLRQVNTFQDIFDYALGLELHSQVSRPNSTLAAGLWTADLSQRSPTLGQIHGSVFSTTLPLSWFIATHFSGGHHHRGPAGSRRHPVTHTGGPGVDGEKRCALIRGDRKVVEEVVRQQNDEVVGTLPFLPSHTITISVGIGDGLDAERRVVRAEGAV